MHDTSPQKALVRRRFYDRCMQRLAKAKAFDKRRFGDQNSDDMDYEDDEEETVDDVMASEVGHQFPPAHCQLDTVLQEMCCKCRLH